MVPGHNYRIQRLYGQMVNALVVFSNNQILVYKAVIGDEYSLN